MSLVLGGLELSLQLDRLELLLLLLCFKLAQLFLEIFRLMNDLFVLRNYPLRHGLGLITD